MVIPSAIIQNAGCAVRFVLLDVSRYVQGLGQRRLGGRRHGANHLTKSGIFCLSVQTARGVCFRGLSG